MTNVDYLTSPERFMLIWLTQDDRGGQIGECRGPTLDRLMRLDLVAYADPDRADDWGYVILTDGGRKVATAIQADERSRVKP